MVVDMAKVNAVDNSVLQNIEYVTRKRLEQERLDEHYAEKHRIQEHHNKKITLDKLMLEAYWAKLDQLETYNRQKQLEKAHADEGKVLDVMA